jgi:malonyl-CoA O-methyltransferase
MSLRSKAIAARFGARAATYAVHAGLQQRVASELARLLPRIVSPRVLEIGCGTGVFSRRLLAAYPDGDFTFTDLSPEMLRVCAAGIAAPCARFHVMDGEAPDLDGPFDVIAMSMTAQWFSEPDAAFDRLRALLAPGGRLVHATPLAGSFSEWRIALDAAGAESGLVDLPDFQSLAARSEIVTNGGARAFLRNLAAIGATMPRAGYAPIGAGRLRSAMRILDRDHAGSVTWRIGYATLAG